MRVKTPIIFQFTPLREGRPDEKCGNRTEEVFQFTPLREGRRVSAWRSPTSRALFQFTPLREGRLDEKYHIQPVKIIISIHAPPRGATGNQGIQPVRRGYISIHAPPRGATAPKISTRSVFSTFQFTPLREGRLKALSKFF